MTLNFSLVTIFLYKFIFLNYSQANPSMCDPFTSNDLSLASGGGGGGDLTGGVGGGDQPAPLVPHLGTQGR